MSILRPKMKGIRYVDTHAHLTSPELAQESEDIVKRANDAGVELIVNICIDETSLEKGLVLKKQVPAIFLAAATTPHDVEREGESFFPIVERAAKEGELVAIGETGLDYHYTHSAVNVQKEFLIRYFELALKTELPLIFHCRDAFQDLFLLADVHYRNRPAVLHCFTGNLDEAREVLDRGWYLSLSGIVTFKKSIDLQEIAKFVPLDRLFLETDSPYLAPLSRRGKRNESAFLVETASKIAELKGVSLEMVAEMTTKNAFQFFSFPKRDPSF